MGVSEHIDLFSGIGGFALAAERTGFTTRVFCEKDHYCRAILKKHWPEVPIIEDIRDFDGTKYRGSGLLSGGFPCQPFSQAGKQLGKGDDRYLWPEMCRVISEARPAWIVGENVFGIINLALEQVHSDLESIHYEVETLIIPAAGVGAPHRRDRCWIIARFLGNAEHNGLSSDQKSGGLQHKPKEQEESHQIWKPSGAGSLSQNVANTDSGQFGKCKSKIKSLSLFGEGCERINDVANAIGNPKGTAHGGNSGERGRKNSYIGEGGSMGSHAGDGGKDVSHANDAGCGEQRWPESIQQENATSERSRSRTAETKWLSESGICRVADGISHRVDRIKSLGNAIVPQVAEAIFENIQTINRSLTKSQKGGNRNDDQHARRNRT